MNLLMYNLLFIESYMRSAKYLFDQIQSLLEEEILFLCYYPNSLDKIFLFKLIFQNHYTFIISILGIPTH